jgi:hypothetical protein
VANETAPGVGELMATVYIHIGAPKTATSSLQAVLAHNDDSLLRRGVLYPRSCRHANAHHPLVCDLIEKYSGKPMADMWYGGVARGQAWATLGEELAAMDSNVHTVVISSELFFGQARHLEPMLEDVREALGEQRIRAVAYLRRQDQMYGSFYNQDVKGTRQWGESAYQFYQTHQLFQRDYFSLLSAWGQAFGKENVLIRPFFAARWQGGDIVRDFCHLTGLPSLKSEKKHESNESLGPNQLYIKRCLNRSGYDKTLNDQVLALLAQLCPEQSSAPFLYVNKRMYGQLRQQWLQTNAKLEAAFLQGEPLFPTPVPLPRELQAYATDSTVLLDFLNRLLAFYSAPGESGLRTLFARAASLMVAEQGLWAQVDANARARLMEWA